MGNWGPEVESDWPTVTGLGSGQAHAGGCLPDNAEGFPLTHTANLQMGISSPGKHGHKAKAKPSILQNLP